MNYRVAFDFSQSGFTAYGFSIFGLIFVVIGLFLVIFRKQLPTRGPKWAAQNFPFVFLAIAVLWAFAALRTPIREYWQLRSAVHQGTTQVVEGQVSKFVPASSANHSREQFCVQNACFSYADFLVTSGFHTTTLHHGPIREGLPVRVTYLGNTIVKLEIAP